MDELEENGGEARGGARGVTGCEDVIIENEARERSPRRREPFEGLALCNELGILTDA